VEAVSNDCAKDRRVLATLLCVVPLEMKVELAVKKSMKEACDAVRSMRANDDHVKSATSLKEVREHRIPRQGFHQRFCDVHQRVCRWPTRALRGARGQSCGVKDHARDPEEVEASWGWRSRCLGTSTP
jgi:hypothetical protein